MPQLNSTSPWTQARTGAVGARPLGCARSSISLDRSGRGRPAHLRTVRTRRRAVAEFPTRRTRSRPARSSRGAPRLCGTGPRHLGGVRPFNEVSVSAGRGSYYLVSYERQGQGRPLPGLVVSGTRLSLLTMDHVGQDHMYGPAGTRWSWPSRPPRPGWGQRDPMTERATTGRRCPAPSTSRRSRARPTRRRSARRPTVPLTRSYAAHATRPTRRSSPGGAPRGLRGPRDARRALVRRGRRVARRGAVAALPPAHVGVRRPHHRRARVRARTTARPVAEVISGVVVPPGPAEVQALVDQVLSGVVVGDFADTLFRAAAFARVAAAGRVRDEQATPAGRRTPPTCRPRGCSRSPSSSSGGPSRAHRQPRLTVSAVSVKCRDLPCTVGGAPGRGSPGSHNKPLRAAMRREALPARRTTLGRHA